MRWDVILGLSFLICLNGFSEETKNKIIGISLHFQDGISSKSKEALPGEYLQDRFPQIYVSDKFLNTISIVLKNRTDQPLFLWKSGCPEADYAITFEFKESEDSKEIMSAKCRKSHVAGGSGNPRVVELSAQDCVVHHVRWGLEGWELPFKIDSGESRKIFMRAVYNPERIILSKEQLKSKGIQEMRPFYEAVWVGKVETEWVKVEFY
jgi:hypothetical protein